ncbi:hypothetical protein EGR_02764 [Echinococcus granulosus]|uniref:Uncharacterized protein n=1 Tax=Echinococcus granulosus TaxID=6210 RepID=W6UME9_ECHGR|nr:hypothetical protein EGR_02764 [Echinococcus granulosus]EUB62311.1 hypothetical protein EGR_02764 [Echinococcus granulosus]
MEARVSKHLSQPPAQHVIKVGTNDKMHFKTPKGNRACAILQKCDCLAQTCLSIVSMWLVNLSLLETIINANKGFVKACLVSYKQHGNES